jgi:hypothetical protein
MKKPLLFIFTLLSTGLYAQEHFSGIMTSKRTGIVNASVNPAELTNIQNNFEINVFSFSTNISNNKISISDLTNSDEDFEDLIFSGSEPVNMNADIEILGPGVAFKLDKLEKWAFAVTTSAKVKANIVDVDTDLGRALTVDPVLGTELLAQINSNYNQRVTSTAWGELGFSAARDIFENNLHKFSAGVTFKLIFPGTYANIAADQFKGTVATDIVNQQVYLTDASANVNIAYSGALAEGFDDMSDYTSFFAGGLNGFSTDIGFNYQWKDVNSNDDNAYKLNAGLAFRNMGKMTFKDDNNESKQYKLNVPDGEFLDLTQFEDVENFDDLEDIIEDNPQYFQIINTAKNFKAKMPALVSGYADYNVYGRWNATVYFQQKLNKDNKDGQIAVQNTLSLTPRYTTNSFEVYAPLSNNEISGFTAGIGFRIGVFYLGSGSVITAAITDSKQADLYFGFRFGL